MIVEKRSLHVGCDTRVWNTSTGQVPDWVQQHIVGTVQPNGTFLLNAALGQQRVHAGYVVIELGGRVWTCPAGEMSDLIGQIKAEAVQHITNIGPGKRSQFGISGPGTEPSSKKTKSHSGMRGERKMAYSPPLGSMPTIEWIHVERLSIDPAYQRSTDNDASRRLVASIAAKFDWRLCAPLVVSRRPDGVLAVIDGQHRTLAAMRRGDIPQLPCCVFGYSGPEEEARMFIAANRARKPMNRLDDFHAALAAADEDALEIQRLVTEAGLTVTRNTASAAWKPGEIAFTAAIATAIRKHGDAVVSGALTNLAEAFPEEVLYHGGSMFSGLVKILSAPPAGFDPDRLFQALLTLKAEQWGNFVAGLKGGDTRAAAMKVAMMDAYGALEGEEDGRASERREAA